MSKTNPTVQKTLLLTQMEADRVALVSDAPPRATSDFRLSPELKPWAIPTALFALSLLKMPPALKAPLRALAVIMLKNRVQEIVGLAQSSDRSRRREATDSPIRREPPAAVRAPAIPGPLSAGRNDPVMR